MNTNIFKVGGTSITLIIFSSSFESPQGALSQPTDATMIQIKQIGIPSLGVKLDGKVTPKNTQTDEFISTKVDPNKWGVTLASSAQHLLYKTSVSKEPKGAVFIPLIARNLCPMTHDERSLHQQSIKRERLTYDVLQSIINLAAEGSE